MHVPWPQITFHLFSPRKHMRSLSQSSAVRSIGMSLMSQVAAFLESCYNSQLLAKKTMIYMMVSQINQYYYGIVMMNQPSST